MADGIGSKAGAVGGQAAGLVSAANKNMSGAYSGGYSAGSQLGEGLKIGIRAKIGAVAREAAKMVYSATAAAKNAAKTASPSRLWRDEIGMQLSAGAAIGIARGSRDVAEAARNAIPHVTIPAVLTPVSLTGGGGGGSLSAAMSDGSLAMNRQIGGQSSVLNRAGDRVQMPVSIKIEGYDKDPLELAREVAREMKGILSFDMNNGSTL